jgi:hypothetical protein
MKRLGFAVLVLAWLAVAPPASAAPAGIFTGDSTGQRDFVDPIVSPGQRSAHEHCFYGAVPIHTVETSAELRTHATTFDVATKHTGVWIPCVYENGVLLTQFSQHGILLYYKSISGPECVPPEDMAGVSREYGYRGQTGGGSFGLDPPASSQDGALVIDIVWRGTRDFGVSCFPTIEGFIRLNVGAGPIGDITLGGPVAGTDGATGHREMHADYFFGDDRAAFERFLAACVRPGIACGKNPTP